MTSSLPLVTSFMKRRIVFWLDSFIWTGSFVYIMCKCVWNWISLNSWVESKCFWKHLHLKCIYEKCWSGIMGPSISPIANWYSRVCIFKFFAFLHFKLWVISGGHVICRWEIRVYSKTTWIFLWTNHLNTFPLLQIPLATLAIVIRGSFAQSTFARAWVKVM